MDSSNPQVYPFTRLPVYPFTRLPVYPFTRLPVYPFTRLPVYPSTRLPVYPSVRPPALRQPLHNFQCVLVVDLLEDLVRQVDAVQLPERVIVAIVIEVVVAGLENAPVIRILVRLERVLPEQDLVLVLDEEVAGGARLPADVVQYRADLRVDVRHVEDLPEVLQVVRLPAHMGGDEGCLRVLPEEVVALCHQRIEPRHLVLRDSTPGKQCQFQPALVPVVHRLIELGGITRVDEHRQSQSRRRVPDRFQLRIVET